MIVSKTALGAQVIKDRSVALSPSQRSALILCDGKRTVDEVVKMTSALGVKIEDVETLSALGLVQIGEIRPSPVTAPAAVASAAPVAAAPAVLAEPVRAVPQANIDFVAALNEAIVVCSNLGFKGFGLNMALASVDSLEKLQRLAPEIRRAAGDKKYGPLHLSIFGKPL